MDSIDCSLTIGNERNNEYLEYEDSYTRKTEGEVSKDELVRMTVAEFNEWVANHDECCRRQVLVILGIHLYNLLFEKGSKIREAFEHTYGTIFEKERQKNRELRLRLILIFHKEVEKLASYPWEFIFMPWKPSGFFLAGEKTDLILTRFVGKPGARTLGNEERPLRILIAFSHPRELGTIDQKEVTDVIGDIQSLDKLNHIMVDYLDYPTFRDLQEKINRFKPHIFHFIGHGEAGKIALMREKRDIEGDKAQNDLLKSQGKKTKEIKEAHLIDSKTVSKLFDKHQPRLVFLNACMGAAPESLHSFNSTARELVYSNIPAVVAMQYEISNSDAKIFARTFYQQIGEGKRIDEAVRAARYELGTFPRNDRGSWDARCFGTPVVYLQSEDPIVLPSAAPLSKEEPVDQPIKCPIRGCTGYVLVTDKACGVCRTKLMECPNCQRIMSKSRGICQPCGYELESGPVRTEAVREGDSLPGNYASTQTGVATAGVAAESRVVQTQEASRTVTGQPVRSPLDRRSNRP